MNPALSCLAVVLACSAGLARAADTSVSANPNPALLYWQADTMKPTRSDADQKAFTEVVQGRSAPTTPREANVGPTSLERLLFQATNPIRPSDWGLLVQEGPLLPLPHLAMMRSLANEQLYLAELHLYAGRTSDGIDRLLTVHAMARHTVGTEPLMILGLVGISIDAMARNVAARHCLNWDAPTRLAYLKRHRALPPMPTLAQMMQAERRMCAHSLSLIGDVRLENLYVESAKDIKNDEKRNAIIAHYRDPAALRQSILEADPIFDRIILLAGQPRAEFRQGVQQLEVEFAESTNPLLSVFFPAYAKVTETTFKQQTLELMFHVALEHGSDLDDAKAASYRDTLDGQPLRLERNQKGDLELLTAGKYSVKPLTLVLGHPAPESPIAVPQGVASTSAAILTTIRFTNHTERWVQVFWIDYGGKPHLYHDLDPGQSVVQSTYVTHAWMAKDEMGKIYPMTVVDGSVDQEMEFRPDGTKTPPTPSNF
jgi:hypothetical protein